MTVRKFSPTKKNSNASPEGACAITLSNTSLHVEATFYTQVIIHKKDEELGLKTFTVKTFCRILSFTSTPVIFKEPLK